MSRQPLEQVVVACVLLDFEGGLLAVAADDFVRFLAVGPPHTHGRHHQVFAGHEGQFGEQVLPDRRLVDHQPARDIVQDVEDAIEGEETFRQGEAAVG